MHVLKKKFKQTSQKNLHTNIHGIKFVEHSSTQNTREVKSQHKLKVKPSLWDSYHNVGLPNHFEFAK